MTPSPLCFIDTETDGVHPTRKPWEVAMIRRDFRTLDSGQIEVTERAISFMVDIDMSTADPFGLQVGRFYERHPKGRNIAGEVPDRGPSTAGAYLTAKAAAERVAQWTHGAHLVGAIPSFDAGCLDPLLREHGLIPGWHYHLIDVEALAVGFINGRLALVDPSATDPRGLVRPPYKSDDLSHMLGVEPVAPEERHTALGDARWALRMYDAVMGGVAA